MANRIIIAVSMLFVGWCIGYIMGDAPCYPKALHQYDYILEVEATDSIEHMFIYDNMHNSVGSFTTACPDSLQIIINQDNM